MFCCVRDIKRFISFWTELEKHITPGPDRILLQFESQLGRSPFTSGCEMSSLGTEDGKYIFFSVKYVGVRISFMSSLGNAQNVWPSMALTKVTFSLY